jgi:hypothetical protein
MTVKDTINELLDELEPASINFDSTKSGRKELILIFVLLVVVACVLVSTNPWTTLTAILF